MTLDGIKITIPDNALVTLPAITVSWQELSAPNAMPGFGAPGVTWAASVRRLLKLSYDNLDFDLYRFKATL
jgi:hypothetical protein